jgi:hypothetical protein
VTLDLDDRQAITELLSRYGLLIDQRRLDEWSEGRRHAHPVPHRHPLVAQDPAELVLDVLVLGVVVLAVQLLQDGLVALVHEEELALGQHLADDLIEQLSPQLQRDRPLPDQHQRLPTEVVDAHVQRHEDVLFGFEVVVEGRLGDAQLLGDLPQAGAVVALLGEEVESHIEDALAGVGLGGRPGALATGRGGGRGRGGGGVGVGGWAEVGLVAGRTRARRWRSSASTSSSCLVVGGLCHVSGSAVSWSCRLAICPSRPCTLPVNCRDYLLDDR